MDNNEMQNIIQKLYQKSDCEQRKLYRKSYIYGCVISH